MTNDEHEQPDELKQQQQSALPLLYLPIELAEEISLYFEGRAAAKLLRVSRSFHSLFLPRAWVRLNTFTAIRDTEVKRHLLERYGHFVRSMDYTDYTEGLFKFDWLPFVKHAAHLKLSIHEDTTVKMAETMIRSIRQYEMLRTLDLRFDEYDTAVKYDDLTVAINGLHYLECITCKFRIEFYADETESEWKRAAEFVDLLHPSKKSKLELKMDFNTYFDEVDVRALAPYIVELGAYEKFVCSAYLADEFFSIMDKDGELLVFPQLKVLEMKSCCFSGENYGIECITPSRLPQLERLKFDIGSCSLLGRDDPRRHEHETYNWKHEYSGYPHIIIPPQYWDCLTDLTVGIVSSSILMDTIFCNPQLEQLIVGSEYSDMPVENDASKYNHDEFQLDTILDRLPHLVEFTIGRLNSRIVADPSAIPMKRRYYINITIGCQMSMTPSAAAYILQMPQLLNITFRECVFVDNDETIQLLQNSAATCGAMWLYWYPIEWHQDLTLAVTEKMSHLERFIARKCPNEHRAVFEAKCRFHC